MRSRFEEIDVRLLRNFFGIGKFFYSPRPAGRDFMVLLFPLAFSLVMSILIRIAK